MLERLRRWFSDDAEPHEKDTTWGVPLWWGAVIVALFTVAISWCNDPSDEVIVVAPTTTTTTTAPTTTIAFPPGTPHLVDLIADQPDLTFFRSLITAVGIDQQLSIQGDFTFFVPSDDAFGALTEDVRQAMLDDPVVADQVLQIHVAIGRLRAADLVAAGGVATVVGVVRTVSLDGDTVLVDDSAVLTADLEATNGLVHIIDGVLGLEPDTPPADLLVGDLLAARSDLGTLQTALAAVDADLLASDPAGVTVFAPSDEAFASLPAGSSDVLLATPPKLLELLGYHVVPGTLLSTDLTDGQVLVTSTGEELVVSIADGTVNVGGVAITEPDLTATDGVVHIVGGVLLPAGYTLPTLNDALALDPITFETSSSVITADGVTVLEQAVTFLTENPDVQIAIEGHTDSQGGEASNQTLSEARANSVRDFLIGRGIAADRLEAAGFGEANPIAPNDTADGRAQNRRIEFRLR